MTNAKTAKFPINVIPLASPTGSFLLSELLCKTLSQPCRKF